MQHCLGGFEMSKKVDAEGGSNACDVAVGNGGQSNDVAHRSCDGALEEEMHAFNRNLARHIQRLPKSTLKPRKK